MRTFYERPSKSQREESYFEAFISLERDLPEGVWTKSEAPDFICTGTRVVGLEITALVVSAMAAIRNQHQKAYLQAQSIAVENGLPIMEVRAKYRNERAAVDAKEAALELVRIITDELPRIDDSKMHVLKGFQGKYYSTIMVNLGTRNGIQWRESHWWHSAHMNWVRRNPTSDIQAIINKKDQKLRQYRSKCQECWLLIGVDEWTASEAVYLDDQGLEYHYKSEFDRVYFLRNIEGKLHRLKLA